MANIIGQRIAMPQIAAPQAAQAQLLQVPADAPPAVGSLGGLFQSVAGPFMDTASRDYKNAETMRALAQGTQLRQAITGKQSLADLAARGVDLGSGSAISAGILGDVTGPNLASYLRTQAYANPANPIGGEALARASMGAGEAYGSTVPGVAQAQAATQTLETMREQARAAAQMAAADIQAKAQERIAGFTPVEGYDANGNRVFSSRAAYMTTPGFHPGQGLDEARGNFLVNFLKGQGAPAAPGTSATPTFTNAPPAVSGATLDVNAPATAGAPSVANQPPDLTNLPPDIREMLNLSHTASTYINNKTGDVVTSFNGGQTGRAQDGSYVDLRQGGYTQAGPETGVGEARNALARQQAAAPSPYTSLDVKTGRLADAVRNSVGIWPAVGREISGTIGSLTAGAVPSLFAGATGGAQELTDFVQRAKGVLANSDQKGIRDQAMVGEMLPGTGVFRSPADEVQKLEKLAHVLALEEQQIASTIKTTTDPQILARAQSKLNEVHNLQGMITEGAKPYAQPGAPAAPAARKPVIAAPPAAAPSIVAPAAAATPTPVAPAVTHVWTPEGGLKPVKP